MTGDPWVRFAEQFPYVMETLLLGVEMTIIVTLGGFVVAVVLGMLGAMLRTARMLPARMVGTLYVDVFRAVPVLTQLFIIYFGLAELGVKLDPIPAAIIGFGINGGAYLTEVFRAGIQAVHGGQNEAALAIGMTRWQALRIIILPQAMRVVLPPLGNFAIGLLKDTSVASSVAAPELSFRAHMLVDQTYLSTQIYLTVAVLYLAMSLPLSRLVHKTERAPGARPGGVSWDDFIEWLPQLTGGRRWNAEDDGAGLSGCDLGGAPARAGTAISSCLGGCCCHLVCGARTRHASPDTALPDLFRSRLHRDRASAFVAAVAGLGLNYAAYMSEVYRAGIAAVHRGQREAALAIGMTNAVAMRNIILPQALRIIVPPMANYAVSLLKDTSVASLISAPELMLRARDLSSEYFMPMELYLLAGAMYLVMAYPLGKGAHYLEVRMGKGRVAS